ncbi:phenylpropionate dioxygenase [Rubidibacter lacunae KORDI 51-2]|uniref:Phenylpropionate dioxygenase n=1 Tax=Rubidibacter lacunae KORDI 51-2 TaxID=582515 RepID=U5DHM0_9CHRO|nr:aromatic ring-hydroxylating dioxygenase subunit alpha [Rubidibacter lacunae]ERN41116.1 phenylpropionate dioxygenase [Rubidibacter lacunae KORDI 51-2]
MLRSILPTARSRFQIKFIRPLEAMSPEQFATLRDRSSARFLPAWTYTDPNVLALERERVFPAAWIYAGDASGLQEPGDVWVGDVAGLSTIVTRDRGGQLRAFHNVCTHRAAQICLQPGLQKCHRLVCPYHAWTFGLDGQLRGVPAEDRFPESFRREDYGLTPVRVEVWEGFLFVNLDGTAAPPQTYLGILARDLAGVHHPKTQLLVRKQYYPRCNWKVYHDNTLCDYHVEIVHPRTLSPLQGPVDGYRYEFDKYVNLLYSLVSPEWRAGNTVLAGLSNRASTQLLTYGIFPNLHLVAMPNGSLAWIRIDPVNADTCQVSVEIYGIQDLTESVDKLVAFFDSFIQEDLVVTEAVQRGYASGVYSSGIANGLEVRILHHQDLWRSHLSAKPASDQEATRDAASSRRAGGRAQLNL